MKELNYNNEFRFRVMIRINITINLLKYKFPVDDRHQISHICVLQSVRDVLRIFSRKFV